MRSVWWLSVALLIDATAQAQPVLRLTLKEARELAVQRHPRLQADVFTALAAEQEPDQLNAERYPSLEAAVTGAAASRGTLLGAGALSNSSVLSRAATGVTLTQLLFDFRRTGSLVESARLRANASREHAGVTRAEVVLEVDRAYFAALEAQAVLRVSEQTVATRRLVLTQAQALQDSGLRSGVDVSLARYDLAAAELMLLEARNDLEAAFATLSAAIGSGDNHTFELADEPLPPVLLPGELEAVDAGLRDRPELRALRLEHAAALGFLEAEKRLRWPEVTAIWNAGLIPIVDEATGDVRQDYNAAAVNVRIPLFEGRLFGARAAEAEYKARAADERLKDEANRVSRAIRLARLDAEIAFRRLALTAELLQTAREGQELAQERYRLGLGSIIELNQAILNVTLAEAESAKAKFEFLTQRSVLDYQIGQLN